MIQRHSLPAPLLLPLLAWLTGMGLATVLSSAFNYAAFMAALLLFVAALWLKRQRSLLILLLVLCLGYVRMNLGEKKASVLQKSLADNVVSWQKIEFKVVRLLSLEDRLYDVRLDRIAGRPVRERVLVYADSSLITGAVYSGRAELSPILSDPVLDLHPELYAARIKPQSQLSLLQLPRSGFDPDRIRNLLFENLAKNTGTESGLAQALLLSDLNSKQQLRQVLSRGGLAHLIVVSGLHIWFIYYILINILGIFLPRRLAFIVFVLLAVLFTALNGWSPPVLRALLMILIWKIAVMLSRPISFLQVISLSLWAISIINPQQISSVSLQLSYLSVLAISLGVPRFYHAPEASFWVKTGQNLIQLVMASLVAGLAVLPLTLFVFGSGSLNGILGNIPAIPLISLILPLSFLLAFLPPALPITQPLSLSYAFLSLIFDKWASWTASLPLNFEGLYIRGEEMLAGLLIVTLLLLLIRGRWTILRKYSLPGVAFIILLLLLPGWYPFTAGVYVFSAGNADCSLFRFDRKVEMMIDTGGVYGMNQGEEEINPRQLTEDNWMNGKLLRFLGKNRVRDIDYLLLTHMHNDHYGGLAALTKAMRVKHLILSRHSYYSESWAQLRSHLDLDKTRLLIVDDTLSLDLGRAKLKILHPDRDFKINNGNDLSVVARLDWAGKSFLLTGDIEQPAEQYLVENYSTELQVDYLKVPHHGSRSSSSLPFLTTIKPREAWVSCARRSRYGFPHPEVLERYKALGIRLRSTAAGTFFVPVR